ncbi:serine/threonine-protein kinase [Stigmatella aurantiaca]|uniref:Protein kinase n=1 Tax=Stigmatella aurantiaca (strain DW4/3-1) TaxID=378806 RepID=Q09DK3_STIAD|nr:serine/threonine-protein kinase [Stigmatella aurantiaca]ADO69309.1 Protein kinase [Stigmatella aurantiaca DW4/3-1]EAU69761.1 protein kinase [Stigmatella aurantiaca DW4/3-1]
MTNSAGLAPGTEIGAWRVVGQQGQGACGAVYRAERVGAEEAGPFALKLALHPLDPRFEREGELLARLSTSHVPRLLDRGWWMPDGTPFPYLVMEWVEGLPLYEWGTRRVLTSRQALRLLAHVARALEATHAVEGVHRDVKGDNIRVRADGTAVLMDFGSSNYRQARTLTYQHPPPGTPEYQSPESQRFQWETRHQPRVRYEAQPADDVYALGVTAYRLCTGKYPPGLELKQAEEGFAFVDPPWVPPETLASVCQELAALIRRMLHEAPASRGSAASVAQALERAAKKAGRAADLPLAGGQHAAPPPASAAWRPALVAALGMCLVVAVWWLGSQSLESAKAMADGHQPTEGPVGLADSTLDASTARPPAEFEQGGMALDVPEKPFPGQHRPPCGKHELKINDGCWGRLGEAAPPCGTRAYEWKGMCYVPIFDPLRPSTSNPP